jgi:O-antigen/teichoic acid export membrane protein
MTQFLPYELPEREVSEPATNEGFREQLPKNLFANVANFVVSIIIGIFLVPYFIGTLGIAAYGLIPLATSLTSYVTILTDSLNVAVSRFLTVDLQRQDYKKANKTFNTAIFGLSGLIILLIPVVVLLSWYAPKFFNIPTGQESEVILLFLGISAAFLIRSWSSNFTVAFFAHNRLDLLNLLNVINIVVQVSLIIASFLLFSPQLRYVGFAYLFSSIVFLCCSFVLSKRMYPHLHIAVKDFDRSRLNELTSMGAWAVVNQMGALLFLQVDLIIVNLLFGADAAGEYAVVFLWVTLIRGIAGTLSGVLTPMILTYYAKGKFEDLVRLSKSAVKGLGLLIALPIGLLCGFAPKILTFWVGPQFAHLAPLLWLLTIPLVINMSTLPLFAIYVSYNKVRVPGLVTLVMGVGNVILACSLPLLLGWGYYGVAVADAIVLTLKSSFFAPWYATKIIGIPSDTFTKSMVSGLLATLVIAGFTTVIGNMFMISSIFSLVFFCMIISVLYLVVLWYIGFNPYEREIFSHYIPKKMRSD